MRKTKENRNEKPTRASRRRGVLRTEEFYEPRTDGAYPEDVIVYERLVRRLLLTSFTLAFTLLLTVGV